MIDYLFDQIEIYFFIKKWNKLFDEKLRFKKVINKKYYKKWINQHDDYIELNPYNSKVYFGEKYLSTYTDFYNMVSTYEYYKSEKEKQRKQEKYAQYKK